jgi:rhodanese-related sulfurtransferase
LVKKVLHGWSEVERKEDVSGLKSKKQGEVQMKKWYLMIMAVLLVAVLVAGCSSPAPTPDPQTPGQVDPKPGDDAPKAEEVLLEAAKAYFAHVAAGNNNMTPSATVKEWLDGNPNSVFILDIRSAEDFEKGHIPGAVHSARGKVGEIMDRIPRNKPVIVACYTGQNAGYTVAYLRMAGFENVTSLFYGIKDGWVDRDKLPLEGTGLVKAADLPAVSAPANKKEEIIWARAKEYSKDIDAGKVGFIPLDQQQAFYEQLQSNPNAYYVLDIRSAEDFAKGHIEHSSHIAWGQFGTILETLPTNVPVVIGCYSGQTSAQTLGVLRMLGFDSAQSILYGIRDGWVAKNNLPVVAK